MAFWASQFETHTPLCGRFAVDLPQGECDFQIKWPIRVLHLNPYIPCGRFTIGFRQGEGYFQMEWHIWYSI